LALALFRLEQAVIFVVRAEFKAEGSEQAATTRPQADTAAKTGLSAS
jgi:hypothetical protein